MNTIKKERKVQLLFPFLTHRCKCLVVSPMCPDQPNPARLVHFRQPAAVHQRIILNELQQRKPMLVGLILLSGEDEVVGEGEEK